VSFAFLSPEWIEAAREIRERYSSQTAPIEVAVRVNQVVTDVPFGDGELHAHIDTSSGDVDLELGHLVRLEMVNFMPISIHRVGMSILNLGTLMNRMQPSR